MSTLYHMQENNIDKGRLKIQITSEATAFPVEDASVRISYTGVPENTLEMVSTDSSGQTETLELAAPPVEYSLDERQEEQPYSEYTLEVTAPGFEPIQIAGTEILSGVTALQKHPSSSDYAGRRRAGVCDPGSHAVRQLSAENSRGRDQTGE